jgi:selenide,water dikinase
MGGEMDSKSNKDVIDDVTIRSETKRDITESEYTGSVKAEKIEFFSRDSEPAPACDIKLTDLSTGGGCGCKIEPAALHEMLEEVPRYLDHKQLLVGIAHKDDAAVYQINDDLALVFTNDFFTPMIDDPYTYGRIAAANALSDVYAMGGKPIMANAIVGMPVNKLPMEYMQQIMKGGVDICHEAGIPLSGGHSIDNPQPIYGLAVVGEIHPNRIKANSSAKPGDILLMTKALGIGVISTGIKLGKLDADTNTDFIEAITEVNTAGHWLGQQDKVHSMTDITGFGLAGHLVEMAEGANVSISVDVQSVPVLQDVHDFIEEGIVPTGAYRNLEAYENQLVFEGDDWSADDKLVFTDPQTNGGLLFSVHPGAVSHIAIEMVHQGFKPPVIIGEVKEYSGDSQRVIFHNQHPTSKH